jgi:hypothetical protein
MNTFVNRLVFIVLFFTFAQDGICQCYVRMEDASGFNTDAYQPSLEDASCALRNSFPAQFQSQFKVYDVGFYLHQETYSGFGYPEAFQKVITAIEGQTSSFILIGKQTDSRAVYSQFYVYVKLPDMTGDGCLLELNSIAANLLQLTIEKEYDQNGRSPYLYANAYKKGFEVLKSFIQTAVACCQNGGDFDQCLNCNNPANIAAQLAAMGFVSDKISNLVEIPLNTDGSIEDYAGIRFDAAELSDIDVPGNYATQIPIFQEKGLTIKVFVTKDETVCTSNWNTIKNTTTSGQYDIVFWHHIHQGEAKDGDEILYSRVFIKGQNVGAKPSAQREFGPDPVTALLGALGSAAVDALIQTTIIYLTDDGITHGEYGKAFEKVNWGSVTWSGFVGLFVVTPKAALAGLAAGDGLATITYNALVLNKYANSPTWGADMTKDFIFTFLGNYLGTLAFNKIGPKLATIDVGYLTTKGWIKLSKAIGKNFLIDDDLIQQMVQQGINFTQNALKFTVKNKSGSIIFLETGNANAGLQHIIERHWKPTELMKFFNSQDEMIEKLFISLRDKNFISKVEKNGGLEFVYEVETKLGARQFKLGVGTNGFIVTFFPQ